MHVLQVLETLTQPVPSKIGDTFHIVTRPDLPYWPNENSIIIIGSPVRTARIAFGIRNAPAKSDRCERH